MLIKPSIEKKLIKIDSIGIRNDKHKTYKFTLHTSDITLVKRQAVNMFFLETKLEHRIKLSLICLIKREHVKGYLHNLVWLGQGRGLRIGKKLLL